MITRCLGNALWLRSNLRHAAAYRRALSNPRRAQEEILFAFLERNATSAYGRQFRYAQIRSVHDFQQAVPVVTYDDLVPWIDRMLHGEERVLTTEAVLRFEKSSGSNGPAKFIPYTETLLQQFRAAIGAWIEDMYRARPGLAFGSQYWSVSPIVTEREHTPGGHPIGMEDDTEYFAPAVRRWLRWIMAAPGALAATQDVGEHRRLTLAHLMRARDLRFISVWNPSFLTLLLEQLPAPELATKLWPRLQLISCWTSGAAARAVGDLERLFPDVEIQGKGLMATEGAVSIPRFPDASSPSTQVTIPSPALTSHFLEFIASDGSVHLVGDLDPGETYRVVLTAGNGFARYDLGDRVRAAPPLPGERVARIEFVGRDSNFTDLCGEKLNEVFVGDIIEGVVQRFDVNGIAMLAPEWGQPPHYLLFVDSPQAPTIAAAVEDRLRTSFHYDYCRRLGQLGPTEGIYCQRGNEAYLGVRAAQGMRLGNVKPTYLRRELDWRKRLAAHA